MLKTAAQHELAVRTSLQRLPHPYNPQNTVTTSSNRIYYVIRDSFQHKIEVFPYSIEVLLDLISIYIIYCMSVLWNINRYRPDSFKSTGVGKCRLPQIAILDVVSAEVVDECRPSVYVTIWHQALSQCWPSYMSPYGIRHWANVVPVICHHMASGTESMLAQLYVTIWHQALSQCCPSDMSPYGIRHWFNVGPALCHHMASDTEPLLAQLYVTIWQQTLSQCWPSYMSTYGIKHWANVDPAICHHMASGFEPMLSQWYVTTWHQALSQCWPSYMSPNGITRPQWIELLNSSYYISCTIDFYIEMSLLKWKTGEIYRASLIGTGCLLTWYGTCFVVRN